MPIYDVTEAFIKGIHMAECQICGYHKECRPYWRWQSVCEDCINRHQEYLKDLRRKRKDPEHQKALKEIEARLRRHGFKRH